MRSWLIPRRGSRRSGLTSRYAKWPATNGYWADSKLGNILLAPRGEPHIEVTFDIDANGILNVTARDKDTNAEQSITIGEQSTLDKSEVERMVAEAETHRRADKELRRAVEARDELDCVATS